MGNANEVLKNNILVEMRKHLDSTNLHILEHVINKELASVDVIQIQTLPATVDDTNNKIFEIFNTFKRPKLSNKTADFYIQTMERLICNCNKPLTKVTSIDIQNYLVSIQRDNQPTSLNNQRRNISAFFTWMRKNHMIIENPCDAIEPYNEIRKPIDHMEPEDYEQLKFGCIHKRDRALIEFLRSTAIRVGETLNIKVSDIDWRTGRLVIYGEKGHAYRPVYLDSVAIKYLKEYIESRGIPLSSNEPLFVSKRKDFKTGITKALTTSGIRGNIKDIAKRAQVNRNIYPHLFRKSTASTICNRGGSTRDAGEYLGHKDRTIAGQYYVYTSEEHTRNIFNKFVATV